MACPSTRKIDLTWTFKESLPPSIHQYYFLGTMCDVRAVQLTQDPLAAAVVSKTKPRRRRRNRYSKRNEGLYVDHEYTDHAQETPTAEQLVELSLPIPSGRGGSHAPPFPMKLHEALAQIEQDGHGETIHWQPHGRCFVIAQPVEFTRILPKYFPSISKITSFQRQLNLYGFKRITQGMDKGCYYHDKFLRGERYLFLAHQMERVKVKGTGVKARANPDKEPHFWAMEPVSVPLSSTVKSSTKTNPTSNSTPQEEDQYALFSGKLANSSLGKVTNNKALLPSPSAAAVKNSSALLAIALENHQDDMTTNTSTAATTNTNSNDSSSASSSRSTAGSSAPSLVLDDTAITRIAPLVSTEQKHKNDDDAEEVPIISDWGASFYKLEPHYVLHQIAVDPALLQASSTDNHNVSEDEELASNDAAPSQDNVPIIPHVPIQDALHTLLDNNPFAAHAMAADFGRSSHGLGDSFYQAEHMYASSMSEKIHKDATESTNTSHPSAEEMKHSAHEACETIRPPPRNDSLYSLLEKDPFLADAMASDFGRCYDDDDWDEPTYHQTQTYHHSSGKDLSRSDVHEEEGEPYSESATLSTSPQDNDSLHVVVENDPFLGLAFG